MNDTSVRERVSHIVLTENKLLSPADLMGNPELKYLIRDSIELANLWLLLEEEFLVYIPQDAYYDIVWFDDLIDLIEQKLREKREAN